MKITEKYVPNLILSILLVFSLIGAAAMTAAQYYILNEETFIENSDENNIPELTYSEIEKYFKDSADYSRIPADVYMSAITKDDIGYIINSKISDVFDHIINYKRINMMPFDYTKLENSITDYFDKFAQENNVEIDDAYNEQLQKTIDTAKSEIEDFADVYMLDFMYRKNIIAKAADIYNYLDPIMYICIGLSVFCIILICGISRKKFRNAFYWISMAFICSSVLMLFPTLYIKFSGMTDKLVIRNQCIYTAITSYISKILTMMSIFEIIILIIGLAFIALYAIAAKKDKK